VGNNSRSTTIQVCWNPPSEGWVCLNIDGACRDGVIGFGGILRGRDVEWLRGLSKLIGRGDAYIAELWDLLEGLRLARRIN
ncbi:ribonuclease H protein, partial [Trifolium medium]|nr:ribonuclease H protein [Trifolium medium]